MINMFFILWWRFHGCIHLLKLIKLHILSVCISLYANYILIKLLNKQNSQTTVHTQNCDLKILWKQYYIHLKIHTSHMLFNIYYYTGYCSLKSQILCNSNYILFLHCLTRNARFYRTILSQNFVVFI